MNRRIFTTVLVVLGMLTMGPGVVLAQDVTVNFAPGVDLSNYRVYKWVRIDGSSYPNELLDTQIKKAVEAVLQSRGLTSGLDFSNLLSLFLAYQVAVTQPQESKNYSSDGIQWGGGAATRPTLGIGAIELHMYDPSTKRLVWQGRVTNTLDPNPDAHVREERLNKAMRKLLEDFPPKPKK